MSNSPELQKVLDFIKAHNGIVLVDWFAKPNSHKDCKVVFPTKLRKPNFQASASEFIGMAINHFYPNVLPNRTGTHRLTVSLGSGRTVQLLESDLERRRITLEDGGRNEYPSYPKVSRKAVAWKFLDTDGILVEVP